MRKLAGIFQSHNIFSVAFLILITALLQQTIGYRSEGALTTQKPWSRFPSRRFSIQPCGACHDDQVSLSEDPSSTSAPSSVRDSYDFIVVGGGTGGSAVARRLAEGGKYSVLVLEYGDYPPAGLDIPALYGQYLNDGNRKIYRTVAQTNAGLSDNGTFIYLAGRMLGGSSALNGMFFNRGSPHNYNVWATITGDPSWNYSNLLKYFRKIEDYQGDFPSDTQHGTGGPIAVSRPKYALGLEQWMEAGKYLGYPTADPNGPQKVSFGPVEFAKQFGRRETSFTGYLRPLLWSRIYHQLSVIVKVDVKRVIFEGDRAVGVIYRERDGKRQNVFLRANKEVIICAGAINSPVILMRSGIGPRDVLQSAKIPVLRPLPVGRSLHDHMTIRLQIIIGNQSATHIPERDLTPEAFRLYNETGDGPYSGVQGTPGQAFIASSLSPRKDWSDIQFHLQQLSPAAFILATGGQQLQLSPWEVPILNTVLLNAPKSRGYVALNSTDPEEGDPIINFNYLSHPDDIQIFKEGIKTALTIFEKTPVYRKMGARYPPNPLPACAQLKFRSDPYWECFIRHVAGSGSHGAGSCRMGKENWDPDAVVNHQLKVLGFQNLRVVDASVMPAITNANTQAAVYVIAEKAAEMILNSWD